MQTLSAGQYQGDPTVLSQLRKFGKGLSNKQQVQAERGQLPDWRFQFRGQCFQTHGGENVLFRWGQRTSDELSDRRNMKQIVCSAYASRSKIFAVVGLLDLRDTVMKTVLPCTDQITQPFWAILLTFCGVKIDPGHSGFTSMP